MHCSRDMTVFHFLLSETPTQSFRATVKDLKWNQIFQRSKQQGTTHIMSLSLHFLSENEDRRTGQSHVISAWVTCLCFCAQYLDNWIGTCMTCKHIKTVIIPYIITKMNLFQPHARTALRCGQVSSSVLYFRCWWIRRKICFIIMSKSVSGDLIQSGQL